MSKLDKAFNYLIELMDDGAEYPDAELLASMKFRVSVDELRELYDSQY